MLGERLPDQDRDRLRNDVVELSVCVAVSTYVPAAENLTVVVEPLEVNCGAAAPPGTLVAAQVSVEVNGNGLWNWSWNWLTVNWADVPLTTALPPTWLTVIYVGSADDEDRGRGRCLPAVAPLAETLTLYGPALVKVTVWCCRWC